MKILYHLRRPPILLGLFGVVWLFAVPYGDFDQTVPFPPEFVLIGLSKFLLCMDNVQTYLRYFYKNNDIFHLLLVHERE